MDAPAVTRQPTPAGFEVGEDKDVRLLEYQGTALVFHGSDVPILDFFERSVEGQIFGGTREIKDKAVLVPAGRESVLDDGGEVITATGLLDRIGELVRHEEPG